MNLTLLRSFYLVAEAGSVSEAARRGYTSQPALSKAVRELERQAGLPLLERGARGVTLTEAGEALHEHARAMFALEREAEASLYAHRTLEAATLRIGASTTIATYVLPPLLARFRSAHPGVTLRLWSRNTREVEARLLAYELDVALIEGPPHAAHLKASVWREDTLVCVCPPGHPLDGRDAVRPEELHGFDWVVREEGSGTREVVESALRAHGLPPVGALEIDGAEAVKQAVAAGLGIAVVSRVAALDQIAMGKLRIVPLVGVNLRRPFYQLHREQRPLSPVARAFEALLRADENE